MTKKNEELTLRAIKGSTDLCIHRYMLIHNRFVYAYSRWLDIACGREHAAAVASDGSLFTRKQPKKVKQLQTEFVISVSCGAHCTAAIAEPHENDGTMVTRRLWVWGQNQGSNYPHLFWGAFAPNTINAIYIRALSKGNESLNGTEGTNSVKVVVHHFWERNNIKGAIDATRKLPDHSMVFS
ncbi:hypothetical protein LOK49_LG06G01059 [Camellia lanceoleosa]|uniref:Uncharacterized protein n=1 Tax=Camellia lanceoleosa TaxID=1840588 RepID=A0ACC0H9B3_9ERIC|nr:hypothetical protein LOK49_LG06G01059 [Camellia lanceoleosa]